jgi:hypothetical protein
MDKFIELPLEVVFLEEMVVFLGQMLGKGLCYLQEWHLFKFYLGMKDFSMKNEMKHLYS